MINTRTRVRPRCRRWRCSPPLRGAAGELAQRSLATHRSQCERQATHRVDCPRWSPASALALLIIEILPDQGSHRCAAGTHRTVVAVDVDAATATRSSSVVVHSIAVMIKAIATRVLALSLGQVAWSSSLAQAPQLTSHRALGLGDVKLGALPGARSDVDQLWGVMIDC